MSQFKINDELIDRIKKLILSEDKSKLIENDGILTIEFLAEKPKKPEQMRIKPHCKVIFKSSGIGQVGKNTVRLDVGCEVIGKPGKPIGKITLAIGKIFVKKKFPHH
mgnify:CR=1 FL=1